jgi:hypothetical protein
MSPSCDLERVTTQTRCTCVLMDLGQLAGPHAVHSFAVRSYRCPGGPYFLVVGKGGFHSCTSSRLLAVNTFLHCTADEETGVQFLGATDSFGLVAVRPGDPPGVGQGLCRGGCNYSWRGAFHWFYEAAFLKVVAG